MWPSSQHVVKVGGRGRTDVPKSMVEPYVERYPSQLPGGSLEGPLPPGRDEPPATQKLEKPAYDPGSPRPDAEHYDPNKVKLPDHDDAAPARDDAARPPDDAAKPAQDDAAKPAAKPAAKKKPRRPK